MKRKNKTRHFSDGKSETELSMDKDLFVQRQRIIKLVNEAKEILGIQLPWIKVRIVSYTSNNLGLCWIDQDFITISEKMKSWSENYLRSVVWHELCHAYFGTAHDENCILMKPFLSTPGTKAELIKALKKHAKSYQKKQNKKIEYLMA